VPAENPFPANTSGAWRGAVFGAVLPALFLLLAHMAVFA
jgi:hypothetical protein